MKNATLQVVITLLGLGAAKVLPIHAAAPVPAVMPAPAADPLAAFYGNTLTIAVPSGFYYASRFINPDGTWTETRGGQVTARGFWKREGDQTCHWQADLVGAQRYCYPVGEVRQVGERWVTEDKNTGNEVIQEIVPGRSPPR